MRALATVLRIAFAPPGTERQGGDDPMPRYVIRVLDSNASLAALEHTIRETEDLGFTAVSLAAGMVGGQQANILTLVAGAPSGPVTLSAVADDEDEKQQSERLAAVATDRTVVSYGGVNVEGIVRNVLMLRA